jgi:hypothetical protein
VLVDHADSPCGGIARGGEANGLAVEQNVAACRAQQPDSRFISVDLPAPFSPSKA